jgi:hypothetical protein
MIPCVPAIFSAEGTYEMPRSASPVARFLMVKVVSLRTQPMVKGAEPLATESWMKASARTGGWC